MFVLSKRADSASQVIATLLATALVLWAFGAHHFAQAANLVAVSNTMTDSNPGSVSGHSIAFTIPAGSELDVADEVAITFPAGFDLSAFVSGDLTVTVGGDAAAHSGASTSSQTVTFAGIDANANDEVVVNIADVIVNPAAGTYEFTVATPHDSGHAQVAIIDNVVVTAAVSTTFEFTVSSIDAEETVNGEETTVSSTATTIPFGTLSAGTPVTIGQRLNVSTNAAEGFVVTVEQDGNLLSSNGADIDGFIDGTYTDTPTAWVRPAGILDEENTYGHWGLTSSDADLNSGEFAGGDLWVSASTTPRAIFSHNGPSNGSTPNIGQADVAYKIEINGLQEAADDYNTTLTYIATPTF